MMVNILIVAMSEESIHTIKQTAFRLAIRLAHSSNLIIDE
jgi:hypothetical protein